MNNHRKIKEIRQDLPSQDGVTLILEDDNKESLSKTVWVSESSAPGHEPNKNGLRVRTENSSRSYSIKNKESKLKNG
jgi:hypothetical protein